MEPPAVADPELQLSPDELVLLLETTTPDDETTSADAAFTPRSVHTSSEDNGSSTDATHHMSIDPKRARRSEIEKLSRRRRQSTLREMRDEVQRLERKMSDMLEAARAAQNEQQLPPEVQLADGTSASASATVVTQLETLRQQFVKLSIDAQRLEREKNDMRRMLRSRQLLSQSVRSLAAAFADDWEEYSWRHVLEQRTYEPLPREEHFRIMRESFEAISGYDARTDVVSSGKALMGWLDRRHIDEDTGGMFFSFTKRFPGRDPEQVMLTTWDIFSQEEMLRKSMALNSMQVRLRVLQEPNDDVVVLHRQTHYTSLGKSFHTVYLLFRLRTDDGFTICFRTIPAPGIQDSLEEIDMWIDIFHWVHFKFVRDEATGDCVACEVVFGGALNRLFDTVERFLLGSFATVVRWENAAIAPMFLVASAP